MNGSAANIEVIVVGGGPAGAAAAAWLARAGHAVTLLDRACFPRDKACGEFLTPGTRVLLSELGAWDAVCAAGLRSLSHVSLHAPDGRQVKHVSPDGSPSGYALRRINLDATLLDHARRCGVDVREGCAVRGLLREDDGRVCGVTAQTPEGAPLKLRARLVIGADGSHSIVARHLGLVRPLPRLQRVAVVTHWRDVGGPTDAIEMRAHGQMVCGMGFPAPSCANLTLVVPTAQAARIAGRAGEFVEETLCAFFPDLAERLSSAEREPQARTVGCFGHVCRPAVADGALLVGDAASFIDPFTGEGVCFGLRGAQLAAETAAQALREGDVSSRALLPYQRARRELARRYLLCDAVQTVVRTPALFNHVVRSLERHPSAADRLLAVLGDLRPATAALHPALLGRLLL